MKKKITVKGLKSTIAFESKVEEIRKLEDYITSGNYRKEDDTYYVENLADVMSKWTKICFPE